MFSKNGGVIGYKKTRQKPSLFHVVEMGRDTSNQLKTFVFEWYGFFSLEENRNLLVAETNESVEKEKTPCFQETHGRYITTEG